MPAYCPGLAQALTAGRAADYTFPATRKAVDRSPLDSRGWSKMVLPVRIELTTSALPRMRSTTELRQHFVRERRAYDGAALALSTALRGRSAGAMWLI